MYAFNKPEPYQSNAEMPYESGIYLRILLYTLPISYAALASKSSMLSEEPCPWVNKYKLALWFQKKVWFLAYGMELLKWPLDYLKQELYLETVQKFYTVNITKKQPSLKYLPFLRNHTRWKFSQTAAINKKYASFYHYIRRIFGYLDKRNLHITSNWVMHNFTWCLLPPIR